MGKRLRVALIDDHAVVRQGLGSLLVQRAPDVVISGEAATAAEGLVLLRDQPHDLVLLDVSLPGRSGLELLKDITVRWPTTPVVFLSMHADFTYAERAIRGGARGYVLKSEGIDAVVAAIRRVIEGAIYVSPVLAERFVQRYAGGAGEGRTPVERLTDREFEVFKLFGEGLDAREIAAALHISARTVETYRQNIRGKLGTKRVRDLYLFAARWVQEHR